ncbi:peptidase M13 [Asticcacaulis sp. AC460]|uniref:M13 family metallopeptidase n=1 Tax=Asticcacaulis sp. AC460 TaxID=1282360 RepID=UPI0003C3F159|nr:M13-type metalloendopeptidase [Asticcacaulis sp. AC460]ESQ92939.1 peptidase M13 [Asticcacaulis sp. AC460]
MRTLRTRLLASAMILALPLTALPALAEISPPTSEISHRLVADPMPGAAEPATPPQAKRYGTWGFAIDGMDTAVEPGDSFFEYANGTALKNMQIPGDQPSYGSFNILYDLSEVQLNALITGLAGRTDVTGEDLKIADMYRSAMNRDLKNQRDVAPFAPQLRQIAGIKTKAEMAAYMGWTSKGFGSSFFNVFVYDDAKKPGYYALQMTQSGLGLPDRDYYLSDTYADKKAAYQSYITDLLRMVAYPNAEKAAADIVALETEIAKVHWTAIESRDDTKTYNPMALKDLNAYAPGFAWDGFFKAAGVDKAQKVVVGQNTAVPKIARIYADTPLETLKAWETFRAADQAAAYLSDRFYSRRFDFRSGELYGVLEQRPLWKRAISITGERMGEALGKAYVADYFPADSKAKMEGLVNDLLGAMKIRIENLTWMSAPTKAKALEKLSTFGVKIGYPDEWRSYAALEVKPDDLYGNIERSSAFEWDYQLARIDNKIDPGVWEMNPQDVNAYYSPTKNEIVFPAAILQPPFFDPQADPAVNYGAIGGVIGHEITHGFDDQGRHYDAEGVLTDWWTAEDSAKFDAEAKMLGAQYDAYEPLPGIHIQGGLTMGENIADLGGILLGLDAYKLSLKGQPSPVLDGFTGEQRVFLGFAQAWQTKYQPDLIKFIVASDPHSPDMFRAIGPVRNVDAWYDLFKVKADDTYYVKPEDRVKIW